MDEIIKNYNPNELSFENIWLLFKETDKKFKETDKKIKETDKKFKDALKEIFANVDKQLSENAEQMRETDRMIKDLLESNKMFANFKNNIADTAEKFFIDAFSKRIKENPVRIKNFIFDDIFTNHHIGKKSKKREFDIVLINDKAKILAIIEIKTKLHENNFRLVEKVKEYIKEDRLFYDYDYIFGFASFNIPQECELLAKKKGIFLVKPNIQRTALNTEFLEQFEPKLNTIK